MKYIIGISCFYHDSAAVLLEDGNIIFAAQEERFTRIKHDSSFPTHSIREILKFKNLSLNEIDAFIFYEKPFLKFERLLETYIAFAPKGFISFCKSIPIWLRDKLFQKKKILDSLKKIDKKFEDINKIFFSEHHLSHAASAFYPSPYDESLIITLDGVGEWVTTSVSIGFNSEIKRVDEINFPHSLGLLYSAFTYFLGFRVNSGEYKVMGLAPYGEPKYKDIIYNNLIEVKEDGSFKLNMNFFSFTTNLKMVNKKFEMLFGIKTRAPETDRLEQIHMDIAASLQEVLEDVCMKIFMFFRKKYDVHNICLAGGVALNCVMNGKVLKNKIFENIWVQPASGDAGGALGAALAFWYQYLKKPRIISKNNNGKNKDLMLGCYLGNSFADDEIANTFNDIGAKYTKYSEDEMLNLISQKISIGKAVGWFNGRMEFGPRALGARSILADPRNETMQRNLNLKIKFRESFRPFAPAILKQYCNEWFELEKESPYMMFVANLRNNYKINFDDNSKFGIDKLNVKRSVVPAITHVDYSARIQTVDGEYNQKFFKLLKKFYEITGCPILINTSFNIRGEPIVNTPKDAFNCFMGTDLDLLVVNNFVLNKNEQSIKKIDYKNKFNLD